MSRRLKLPRTYLKATDEYSGYAWTENGQSKLFTTRAETTGQAQSNIRYQASQEFGCPPSFIKVGEAILQKPAPHSTERISSTSWQKARLPYIDN